MRPTDSQNGRQLGHRVGTVILSDAPLLIAIRCDSRHEGRLFAPTSMTEGVNITSATNTANGHHENREEIAIRRRWSGIGIGRPRSQLSAVNAVIGTENEGVIKISQTDRSRASTARIDIAHEDGAFRRAVAFP